MWIYGTYVFSYIYIFIYCIFQYPQQVQYFNLTITPCPPGHVLHSTDEEDEYECQCNDDNDDNIVSCLPEESRIVLEVCLYTNHVIFIYCICVQDLFNLCIATNVDTKGYLNLSMVS